MERKNVWIDIFGWCFLIPSIYRTVFVGRYLSSPYLEHIDYSWYFTLHEKLSITAEVWVIPIVSAVISPLFVLIAMGIIFRQAWARLLLIIICGVELFFVAGWSVVAVLLNPGWIEKNLFNVIYLDEMLWFVAIPISCIYVFSRPNVKKLFA